MSSKSISKVGFFIVILAAAALIVPEILRATAESKQLIGPTATVKVVDGEISLAARVDTGATTSSMHVERLEIEDEATDMASNVGKKIRIFLKNRAGQSACIINRIAELTEIRTSEAAEYRYKVVMTLNAAGVTRRCLVSLNDRSDMKFPALLGRNFLQGQFLVDVGLVDSNEGHIVQSDRPNRGPFGLD